MENYNNYNVPKDIPNPPKSIDEFLERLPDKLPFSRVEDNQNLIRDELTKAIININMDEYNNYKEMKKIKDKEYARVENIESEIKNLKSDLTDIKNLLTKFISNGS